ncbi:unnamed protein product [Tilletia controversa]|nr:unnamed protein product [Tilletia controversa]CAD6928223.1 unnamed protein product [Tilletia controversa]CAD6966825.1 unnamed protein product [Tilletia controversa]CAD6978692.1 unnamed protein product [Tilletia controversa]
MLPSPSTHRRPGDANTWSAAASSWLSTARARSPAATSNGRSALGYAPIRDRDPDEQRGKGAHRSGGGGGGAASRGASGSSSGRIGGGAGEWSVERRSAVVLVVTCILWYLSSAMTANTSQALLKSKSSRPAHPSTGGIVPPNLDAHQEHHEVTGTPTAAKTPSIFPYPITLALIQFVFVHIGANLCCSRTLLGRHRLSTLITPTWSRVWQVGQLSAFSVVGHLFTSAAIGRVPVSTVQTIKALSPLVTVIAYSSLFNVSYPFKTYFSLLPLTFGVMLACSGFNISGDDIIGFSAALASTFVVVAQNIYSKKLMGGAGGQGENKLDKMNILYVSSATSILLLLPSFLLQDVPRMLRGRETDSAGLPSQVFNITYLLTVNGLSHFAQMVLAFSVLSLVSPVTYSIASLFKRVFVIIVAIIWFGQAVTLLQWIGIAFTFGGLYLYNDSKPGKVDEHIQRRERQQQLHLPLPNERQQAESDLRAASPGLQQHSHASYPPPPPSHASSSQTHHDSVPARHRMLASHVEPLRTHQEFASAEMTATVSGAGPFNNATSHAPSVSSPLRRSFTPQLSTPGASGPGRPSPSSASTSPASLPPTTPYPMSPPPPSQPEYGGREPSAASVASSQPGVSVDAKERADDGQSGRVLPITPPDSTAGAPDSEGE